MSKSTQLSTTDQQRLGELGQQLRVDAVRAAATAGSGHPTSSMSAADLVAVLADRHLRYDFSEPGDPAGDHLIFSKGHASPLLYAVGKAAGALSDEELLSYRQQGSRLEGHPTPRLPFVEVATGSLGQGLPIGTGLAWVLDRLEKLPNRVWVLCGDSELAEGSVWEAVEHAGTEALSALTLIIDVNRLGQRGPTRHGWNTEAYAGRLRAFGWHASEIDGHSVSEIDAAYADAHSVTDRPTAIVARTVKGSGVSSVADVEGVHGKPVQPVDEAVDELGGRREERIDVQHRPPGSRETPPLPNQRTDGEPHRRPSYQVGTDAVATRDAFATGLAALADVRSDVVGLDGEVADSTRLNTFAESHPERFFECYIAEQLMVASAVGMQVRGWKPYAATFAAFLTRAFDIVRMAAVSRANLCLVGSHAGVAIGPDGPSQMGLEDLAMFRAVANSTVLCPCDANQTVELVHQLASQPDISYLRTTRGSLPVIYPAEEPFEIGGSKTLRSSNDDVVTIAAAGTTVHEALRAADSLAGDGIRARVLDLYSIKPIDENTIRAAAAETGNLVTAEDHWPQGGLGDAVAEVLSRSRETAQMTKLAVGQMPASATPDEQLQAAGIDNSTIAEAATTLVQGARQSTV